MGYLSLYRKHRPRRFSELVGQERVAELLRASVASGQVSHAYLFSGPRGCGKTSAARILARAVNCLNPQGGEPCNLCEVCLSMLEGSSLDLVEIDGASNRGIDEVRQMKEQASMVPFRCRRKVYIVDEVHMLTEPAFNALLKTLEEPPLHVLFVLATTDPQRVPVTVRSRCQQLPFRRVDPGRCAAFLRRICEEEGIPFDDEALRDLAMASEGSLRDALSLLEQVAASGGARREEVSSFLGISSYRRAFEFLIGLEGASSSLEGLVEEVRRGGDLKAFLENVYDWCYRAFRASLGGFGEDEEASRLLRVLPGERAFRVMEVALEGLRLLRMGLREMVVADYLLAELLKGRPSRFEGEVVLPPSPRLVPEALTSPADATPQGPLGLASSPPEVALEASPGPSGPGPVPDAEEGPEASVPEELLRAARERSFLLTSLLLQCEARLEGDCLVLSPAERFRFHLDMLLERLEEIEEMARSALGLSSVRVEGEVEEDRDPSGSSAEALVSPGEVLEVASLEENGSGGEDEGPLPRKLVDFLRGLGAELLSFSPLEAEEEAEDEFDSEVLQR